MFDFLVLKSKGVACYSTFICGLLNLGTPLNILTGPPIPIEPRDYLSAQYLIILFKNNPLCLPIAVFPKSSKDPNRSFLFYIFMSPMRILKHSEIRSVIFPWSLLVLFCLTWFNSWTISSTSPGYPAAAAKSLQSCPTLCDPIDGSPPGTPVPGILQARTLEWVAISFSNAWKWSHSVVSDPQRTHGLQPTRLLHPWDFLGKSTGVGCHCLFCRVP